MGKRSSSQLGHGLVNWCLPYRSAVCVVVIVFVHIVIVNSRADKGM